MDAHSIGNTAIYTVRHIGRVLTIGMLVVIIVGTVMSMMRAWIAAQYE